MGKNQTYKTNNIHTSVVFLYTKNKTSEKNLSPIHNSIKSNKILSNKFNQGSETLYSENYKNSMKDSKDTNKWNNSPYCSWIVRIYIIRSSKLPRAIYRFSAIPSKIPMAFFKEIEKTSLKYWSSLMTNQICIHGSTKERQRQMRVKSLEPEIHRSVWAKRNWI